MGMFGGSAMPSLSDIAAVTGNRDNDGFGGNNGWWILIILFALWGGFGNGGYGYGGGNQVGYDTNAALQRGFDTQAIISKLDGINGGICSLGYDQLSQMNGINQTIMQTGYGLQQSVNQLGINNMQDTFGLQRSINQVDVNNMQNVNALSRQLSDCCCENRQAIAQLRYDMATSDCAIRNEVHQTGDAIINNQNAGFNMLNQTIQNGFTSLAMAEKDKQIAELTAKLNACDRDNALQGQTTYLLNQLNPTARPAYIVQNPNCCSAVPVNVVSQGCGCNSGCGGCSNGF